MMPSYIKEIDAADIALLRSDAREKGEAFCTMVKNEAVRINLAARRDGQRVEYTIEALVCLVKSGGELDAGDLDASLSRTKALISQGYRSGDQDEAWICCEKKVVEEHLIKELSTLASTMGVCR